MHKYEEYMKMIDGNEAKEKEADYVMAAALHKLKSHDEDDFECVMEKLHCLVYGPHFDEHLAKKAVSEKCRWYKWRALDIRRDHQSHGAERYQS